MALGQHIKQFREARRLSQDALSRRTGYDETTKKGVSQGAISALEKRDSKASRHTTEIAKALGVDPNDLIAGNDNYSVLHSHNINLKASEKPTLIEMQQQIIDHLAELHTDDMDVWFATIRAAANKVRRQRVMERGEKDHGHDSAHDPPIGSRRTA